MVHVPTLTVYNRHGQLLSIADEFEKALTKLWECASADMEWLDCEMLSRRHEHDRGVIVILDWVNEKLPYWKRHSIVANTFTIKGNSASEGVTSISHSEDAVWLWEALQRQNELLGCDYFEGIVGKQWDSPYVVQQSATKTTPLWVKWRFDQYKEMETPDYGQEV